MLNDISAVGSRDLSVMTFTLISSNTGQNVGQSQHRHAEDVPRRSSRQTTRNATLPLRLHYCIRRSLPTSEPRPERPALGAMLMRTPAVTSGVLVSKVQDSGIVVGYRLQALLGWHWLRKRGRWLGYDPFLSTDLPR